MSATVSLQGIGASPGVAVGPGVGALVGAGVGAGVGVGVGTWSGAAGITPMSSNRIVTGALVERLPRYDRTPTEPAAWRLP